MREWIEISGAELLAEDIIPVLPRMREWIEMEFVCSACIRTASSPSYEGVD